MIDITYAHQYLFFLSFLVHRRLYFPDLTKLSWAIRSEQVVMSRSDKCHFLAKTLRREIWPPYFLKWPHVEMVEPQDWSNLDHWVTTGKTAALESYLPFSRLLSQKRLDKLKHKMWGLFVTAACLASLNTQPIKNISNCTISQEVNGCPRTCQLHFLVIYPKEMGAWVQPKTDKRLWVVTVFIIYKYFTFIPHTIIKNKQKINYWYMQQYWLLSQT